MGIDVGTGGTRALIVDAKGMQVAAVTAPHEDMRMERPLWAEQRPEDWARAAMEAIRGVLAEAGVKGSDVRGIGLSGQMHGLVLLDRAMEVIRPALIWCDQRSQAQVDFINRTIGREKVLASIANPVLTGFTLPKLLWVRDHEPHHFERVRKKLLPKDYIRFHLTGEFATEVSDASGTALFDVNCRRWSLDMMDGLEPGSRHPAQRARIEQCQRSGFSPRGRADGSRGGHAGGGRRRRSSGQRRRQRDCDPWNRLLYTLGSPGVVWRTEDVCL